MAQSIKEVALDYIASERECNFYAANHTLTLLVYNQSVDVESIWRGVDSKVYLHCGCQEFEADIDIESLSDKNQERVREVLMYVSLSPAQIKNLTEQWKDKPLIFLFRADDVEREEIECFKRCADFFLLSEFSDAWNDTDDDEQRLPEVKKTWCYLSQPERKSEEQVKKKDRLLKETIVLLAADMYKEIYDLEGRGWGQACDEIIRYAEQFERELDWKDEEDRNYIDELEKFEKKVMEELNK